MEMVLPIIPSFLETSWQPHSNSTALPFERNLVILKRRLPRQTSSSSLQRPIWNTFLSIRTNFLQCKFHMMGWGGAARRRCLKNFEGALNRLNGIPSYETFLSREFIAHSAFCPDYVKAARDHPRFVPP